MQYKGEYCLAIRKMDLSPELKRLLAKNRRVVNTECHDCFVSFAYEFFLVWSHYEPALPSHVYQYKKIKEMYFMLLDNFLSCRCHRANELFHECYDILVKTFEFFFVTRFGKHWLMPDDCKHAVYWLYRRAKVRFNCCFRGCKFRDRIDWPY